MPLFLDLFAGFLAVFLHMFDEEFGIYKEILCLNAFGQTASLNSYAYLGTPSDHAENCPDSLSTVGTPPVPQFSKNLLMSFVCMFLAKERHEVMRQASFSRLAPNTPNTGWKGNWIGIEINPMTLLW